MESLMLIEKINYGAIILAFVTVGIAILAILLSRFWRKPRRKSYAITHGERRLEEVQEYLLCQQSAERSNKIASVTLMSGQYIIGGVLATSFIQETLPASIIGLLGVLVVFSSIINQQFRPDLKLRKARDISARTRSLIRLAEDRLEELRSNYRDPDDPEARKQDNEIAQELSRKLNELEDAERLMLESQVKNVSV